jgi:hypothetical protein
MTAPIMPLPQSSPQPEPDIYSQLVQGEDDSGVDPIELKRRGMAALYGSDFPLIRLLDGSGPTQDDWVRWPLVLWGSLRAGIQKRLHKTERNRLMRDGDQWVTSIGLGPWTTPPKPRSAARMVVNMIAPALDQRLQVITEQRPGFRTKPATLDPDASKRAEAQQLALEYQYDQQGMMDVIREAAYWAGTDGSSFICSYWDPDRGPWSEQEIDPQGESFGADGSPPTAEVQMGDIATKVYRIEQVRVSPNATSTEEPFYWRGRAAVAVGARTRRDGRGRRGRRLGPV